MKDPNIPQIPKVIKVKEIPGFFTQAGAEVTDGKVLWNGRSARLPASGKEVPAKFIKDMMKSLGMIPAGPTG